ncbi:MAG: AAA family ATPase [Chloroflexota bacterium]
MATRVSSPLFIGRQAELANLTEALDRAATGVASTVLIGGDAGIGKSRLVAEVSARAASSFLVLEGGCVALGDGGGLPFAPIVEALRRLPAVLAADAVDGLGSIEVLRSPATAELGRLVPELGSAAAPDVGTFDRPEWIQARIFEGLLALLRGLGEHRPVVLILEDLHWADGSTRDVTSFLARNARTERLVVIGTYRTDELHRRHPLRPWLSEMERLPRVERISLTRFGRSEIDALVAAILDHSPPVGLVDSVERRTEGNPFFVEELLASGAEQHGDNLPQTLRDVLLARLTSLSEETQQVLGIAAVAGRRVQADLLATVAGVPEAELERPLREALASQIVVADSTSGADAYRFRHALLTEAVYDDLLPSARRRLHAAYAAALESKPVPEGAEGASHLSALAHHATAAHEPTRALHAWVGAARAAVAAYAFSVSLTAYERAIDLWDAVPADDRPQGCDAASLHHEASLAAMLTGRPDRAVDFARVALSLIDPAREPERWASANERLARASWVSGAMDDGLAILESTAAALEGSEPTPVRARVVAALAGAHMLRGDHATAIVVANAAIVLARLAGSPSAEAHALNTLGTSTALTGRTDEGLRYLYEAFEQTKAIPDAYDDVGRAYANLSSVLLIAGRAQASFEIATAGVTWARSVGAAAGYGRFNAGNAAEAAVELGRWDEAEAMLDDLLASDAVGVNHIGTISVAGWFFARRGRTTDAERVLRDGRALVDPLLEAQFKGQIYVGLIELALMTGRLEDAIADAAAGLEQLQRTEDHYYIGPLLVIAARAEADVAVSARARRDPVRADRAAAAAGRYADQLTELATTATSRDVYGGRLAGSAAVAAAEAKRAAGTSDPTAWIEAERALKTRDVWLTAYAQFRRAESLLRTPAGRREAESVLQSAHAGATALSAAPLVAWIEALGRRARIDLAPAEPAEPAVEPTVDTSPAANALGLTAREREVLELVAEGFTNRRIAEALFISESTAGVHVSNILGKLGAASRTEAATIAARLGLVD